MARIAHPQTEALGILDIFERHEAAFRLSRKPYSYMPAAWRSIARELVDNGENLASVARRMGVSSSTVKRWTARDDIKPLPPWRRAQQRRIRENDHVPPYVLRDRSWSAST